MNIVCAGRSPLSASCIQWRRAPVTVPPSGSAYLRADRYMALVQPRLGESASATFERTRLRIFSYDIFPSAVLRHAIWPEEPIRPGTVIIQRIQLGLLALEAAVRVIEIWDWRREGVREAGFRYATLQGHPECGIASFQVRQDEHGVVTVVIQARSQPGLLLTRLAGPIARAFQRRGTRSALRRLARS